MTNDAGDLTVRDLCALARELRDCQPGSRRYRQITDQIAFAATYLANCGVLSQMMWWCKDIEPEAPPDAKAEVVQFPQPRPGPMLVME